MPQVTWGEFARSIVRVEEAHTMYGLRVVFRTRRGVLYLNKNVERRVRKMGGLEKIPEDWIVAHDGEWVYRIASPNYVDVPPSVVEGLVREAGVPISLGKWGNRVYRWEGATYGEYTIYYSKDSSPRVGSFVAGLRITFGNDGYTAFRVTRFIGVLECENGLIMGVEDVERLLHAKHPETVITRLRRVIEGFVRPFGEDAFRRLEGAVNVEVLEEAFRRIGDFHRLWGLYRQRFGETNLALAQALSWYTTHGGRVKAKAAEALLLRLMGA